MPIYKSAGKRSHSRHSCHSDRPGLRGLNEGVGFQENTLQTQDVPPPETLAVSTVVSKLAGLATVNPIVNTCN